MLLKKLKVAGNGLRVLFFKAESILKIPAHERKPATLKPKHATSLFNFIIFIIIYKIMLKPYLYIGQTTSKGKAVFTNEKIASGTVIEISPVIVMSKDDRKHLDKTLLHDYIFEWGKLKDKCCMALGLIPIYNHSYKSNCEYFMDFEDDTIFIKTVRVIKKGEELTINYNGNWNDGKKVWFEVE